MSDAAGGVGFGRAPLPRPGMASFEVGDREAACSRHIALPTSYLSGRCQQADTSTTVAMPQHACGQRILCHSNQARIDVSTLSRPAPRAIPYSMQRTSTHGAAGGTAAGVAATAIDADLASHRHGGKWTVDSDTHRVYVVPMTTPDRTLTTKEADELLALLQLVETFEAGGLPVPQRPGQPERSH